MYDCGGNLILKSQRNVLEPPPPRPKSWTDRLFMDKPDEIIVNQKKKHVLLKKCECVTKVSDMNKIITKTYQQWSIIS